MVTRRKTEEKREGWWRKFCFTNYFSRSSKISTIDHSSSCTVEEDACNISYYMNEHCQVEDEFSKSMAGELRSSIYIYIYLETWSSLDETRIYLYISWYQKLSYLSRSNVIRDVDSREGERGESATGSMVITKVIHSATRTETMLAATKFKIRSTYAEDKRIFSSSSSSSSLSLVIRLPFHPGWRAS